MEHCITPAVDISSQFGTSLCTVLTTHACMTCLCVYAYIKSVQFEVSEIESSGLDEEMEGSIAKKVCVIRFYLQHAYTMQNLYEYVLKHCSHSQCLKYA
jgi:hypothetical protein